MSYSREYLESILAETKKHVPSWLYAALHQAALPRSGGLANARAQVAAQEVAQEAVQAVLKSGPDIAAVVFVGGCPTDVEEIRGEPFCGEDGATLRDVYLTPLGLERGDVKCMTLIPTTKRREGAVNEPDQVEVENSLEAVLDELDKTPEAVIVALGKTARDVLAGRAHVVLPHPSAVRRFGDSGEVAKKLGKIRELLVPVEKHEVIIAKADEEKHIVYGVVLDSYGKDGQPGVDSQGDWTPPAEIEKTAHDFMKSSRRIGIEHELMTAGQPVESYIEPYPTQDDYRAAMKNEDHSISARKFGEDVVHSGSWILGVELPPNEWNLFKTGELNAFSIGGSGARRKIDLKTLPRVQVLDVPSPKQAN